MCSRLFFDMTRPPGDDTCKKPMCVGKNHILYKIPHLWPSSLCFICHNYLLLQFHHCNFFRFVTIVRNLVEAWWKLHKIERLWNSSRAWIRRKLLAPLQDGLNLSSLSFKTGNIYYELHTEDLRGREANLYTYIASGS